MYSADSQAIKLALMRSSRGQLEAEDKYREIMAD